jgi:hypothetical protein
MDWRSGSIRAENRDDVIVIVNDRDHVNDHPSRSRASSRIVRSVRCDAKLS